MIIDGNVDCTLRSGSTSGRPPRSLAGAGAFGLFRSTSRNAPVGTRARSVGSRGTIASRLRSACMPVTVADARAGRTSRAREIMNMYGCAATH